MLTRRISSSPRGTASPVCLVCVWLSSLDALELCTHFLPLPSYLFHRSWNRLQTCLLLLKVQKTAQTTNYYLYMSSNALDLKNLKIFSELQDGPMRQLVSQCIVWAWTQTHRICCVFRPANSNLCTSKFVLPFLYQSCFVSEIQWICFQHFWRSSEESEFQLHYNPTRGWSLGSTYWKWMDWIDGNGDKKWSWFYNQWTVSSLWQSNGIAMFYN